jgi:maltooligosyltrehalose synthase
MLARSTHDTKRSGNVRARLNLLSEIPDSRSKAVRQGTELWDLSLVDPNTGVQSITRSGGSDCGTERHDTG